MTPLKFSSNNLSGTVMCLSNMNFEDLMINHMKMPISLDIIYSFWPLMAASPAIGDLIWMPLNRVIQGRIVHGVFAHLYQYEHNVRNRNITF